MIKIHDSITQTFRYKNIVYVPTYKCASTYTSKVLLQLNFKHSNISDVTKNDKMFTTIMDPYARRTKGVTQALVDVGYEKKVLEEDFVKFIKDATVLDHHTIPYTLQHKKYMNQMIFLPIDMENILLLDLFKKFFAIHCPELNRKPFPKKLEKVVNQATSTERHLYKFIQNEASNKEIIALVFADDLQLWKDCKKNIEKDLDNYLTSKYQ